MEAITLGDLVAAHILDGLVAVFRYEAWEGCPEFVCYANELAAEAEGFGDEENLLAKPVRGISSYAGEWYELPQGEDHCVEVALGEWDGD